MGGSSVAERSKAIYTGSRGRGFESRSFLFSFSESPLSSLLSPLYMKIKRMHDARCTMTMHTRKKKKEEGPASGSGMATRKEDGSTPSME